MTITATIKWGCALLLSTALVACGADEKSAPAPDPQSSTAPAAQKDKVARAKVALASGLGTPNEDRVATIGLLNKRNNLTQDLDLKVGESRRVGNVIIKLQSCEKTAPWESQQEEGAFVQVFVEERPAPKEKVTWRKVFSGWLFKNSPSLNVLEHPIYDVWVKKCAMNFPGDEAKPASPASSSNKPKASGNDNG